MAKRGTPEDLRSLKTRVNDPEIVVPKLVHVLAPRYKGKLGGYVRILKNGYRSSGSDRAPKAIIELVGNMKDIVYHTSQLGKETLKSQLEQVEQRRYVTQSLELKDPVTGEVHNMVMLHDRPNIPGSEKKKLMMKQVTLHRKIKKFNINEINYEKARVADEASVKKLRELAETHVRNLADKSASIKEKNETDKLEKILRDKANLPPIEKLEYAFPVGGYKMRTKKPAPPRSKSGNIVEDQAEKNNLDASTTKTAETAPKTAIKEVGPAQEDKKDGSPVVKKAFKSVYEAMQKIGFFRSGKI